MESREAVAACKLSHTVDLSQKKKRKKEETEEEEERKQEKWR